jgi:hypothetical protein
MRYSGNDWSSFPHLWVLYLLCGLGACWGTCIDPIDGQMLKDSFPLGIGD